MQDSEIRALRERIEHRWTIRYACYGARIVLDDGCDNPSFNTWEEVKDFIEETDKRASSLEK